MDLKFNVYMSNYISNAHPPRFILLLKEETNKELSRKSKLADILSVPCYELEIVTHVWAETQLKSVSKVSAEGVRRRQSFKL